MNHLKLTHDKLEIGEINDLVAHETCGAISFFVGTTRDNFEEKTVVSLEYEAYEPMALKSMNNICTEIRQKWEDVHNIAIYHRLGLVPVKEASVIIAISSPHRQASLEAINYAIETLKKQVPIWKKEQYSNAEPSWKANAESQEPKKFIKRPPLDFSLCPVVVNPKVHCENIQIRANEVEVKRRIDSFIKLQQSQRNAAVKRETGESSGCARIDLPLNPEKYSKHSRVRRTSNETGPQIIQPNIDAVDELQSTSSTTESGAQSNQPATAASTLSVTSSAVKNIDNRLAPIESFMKINPPAAKTEIFRRIKDIEERILQLESLSPEYVQFIDFLAHKNRRKGESSSCPRFATKKSYTAADIDHLIANINQSIDDKSSPPGRGRIAIETADGLSAE